MKKQKQKKTKLRYSLIDEMLASPTNPLPESHKTHQLTRMYSGLHNLETASEPTSDDWMVCADAVNLMETLVDDMQICEDASGLLKDAVNSLALAGKRNKQGFPIRLDGAGIQAVRAVLSDYASLIDILPERTMIRCHRLTEMKLQNILNKKPRKDDVIISRLKLKEVPC
jgi:hypothetical protein